MVRRGSTRLAAIVAAALPIVSLPAVAQADVVQNSVSSTGQTSVVADGVTGAVVSYTIQNTNRNDAAYPDTENSCNPAKADAVLTVTVPANVTVSPRSATYTGCGTPQSFTFRASAAGDYPITVSISGSVGTYYTAPATFTLRATATVTNQPPVVTVTGVSEGASYSFGAVPAAGCSVTDAEDGSSSSAASLSAITGPRSAAGLGSQTASCSYTDRGGLTRAAQATYGIVDTTPPAVSVPGGVTVEATGPTTAVPFAATASDAVDGELEPACSPASGSGFPVGTTTVTCSATDVEGNTGRASFGVTITDTTAPDVTVPAGVTAAASSANGGTATWTGVGASDLVDGVVPVRCDRESGDVFPLGATEVTCTAADSRGNRGAASFWVTVQDEDAPVVTVPGNVTEEATAASGTAVGYRGVSARDDVDGDVAVSCDVPSGATFALGATDVTCSAVDRAGNRGSNVFTVTVVDTTAPRIAVPAGPVVVEADSALGAVASFDVAASDAVDGAVAVDCSADSGEQFPLGSTMVTCDAADSRGNAGRASFLVRVVDTTAPELSRPADVTEEATGPDGAAVDFPVEDARDLVDGAVTPVCTPASGTVFGIGDTAVRCVATDAAGNSVDVFFTVTVQDTTEPTVPVPANPAVGATDRTGAVVEYGTVTADDLVDGALEARCSPASGSLFPLGVTEVECSATDAAGNTGSATFTVTVQDRKAPTVTVPASMTLEAGSAAGAEATWTVSASDDVDDDPRVGCDPESGATFPLGTTTVTCTATDEAGNEGSNTFDVTVRDTTAPVVTVGGPVTVTATSASGAAAQFPPATALDRVDGVVAAGCDRRSGGMFPLGTTTVTCTATDAAGNTGTATFTVMVGVPWSDVLQPVSPDGRSVFKQGSTVPVKFRLTGASAGITDLPARLSYAVVGATGSSAPAAAVSTNGGDRGNLFRYDPSERQYVFNLNTKLVQVGTYQLSVDLGDGVPRHVTITLR